MKRVLISTCVAACLAVAAGIVCGQTTAPFAEVKPKAVTVAADKLPLSSVFDQLKQQTGFEFGVRNKDLLNSPVTLDGKESSQWETLSAALGQADPTLVHQWTMRRAGADSGTGLNGRLLPSGAFMFVLTRLTRRAGLQDDGRVILTVQVMGDATIHDELTSARMETTPAVATDDQGNSLVWTGMLNNSMKTQSFSVAVGYPMVSIVLKMPPVGSKKLTKVEGLMPVTVAKLETFEVTPGGEKKEIRSGKMSISVGCSPAVPRPQASVSYIPDEAMSDAEVAEWKGQLDSAKVAILDEEGKPMPLNGRNTGSRDRDRSLSVSDTLVIARGNIPAAVGTPTKAVLTVPTSFRKIMVPYHFEDLDLP